MACESQTASTTTTSMTTTSFVKDKSFDSVETETAGCKPSDFIPSNAKDYTCGSSVSNVQSCDRDNTIQSDVIPKTSSEAGSQSAGSADTSNRESNFPTENSGNYRSNHDGEKLEDDSSSYNTKSEWKEKECCTDLQNDLAQDHKILTDDITTTIGSDMTAAGETQNDDVTKKMTECADMIKSDAETKIIVHSNDFTPAEVQTNVIKSAATTTTTTECDLKSNIAAECTTATDGIIQSNADISYDVTDAIPVPDNHSTSTLGSTTISDVHTGISQNHSAASEVSFDPPASSALSTISESILQAEPLITSPGSEAKTEAESVPQSVYHIKWIRFQGTSVPIITQNENGPCPLLSIANIMMLKGKLTLPSQMQMINYDQLMGYLANWIFENVPKNINEANRLNYEQNMNDAMAVFPKLQTGLDVNVRFTGVSQFEYTPECTVFDLLNIPLYHGWLVDPASRSTVDVVANSSYNQLVEKIITQKTSSDPQLVTEALVAEEFLNTTASQLTYHGLCELSVTMKEEELGVFFRNNHFSTLYKHKSELFLLVTDQGLLSEPNVVWETLANVDGDSHFVDSEFHTYFLPESRHYQASTTTTSPTTATPAATATTEAAAAAAAAGGDDQIDRDYLVALSLQGENEWLAVDSCSSDLALAQQLQEEENIKAAQAKSSRTNNTTTTSSSSSATALSSDSGKEDKKKKDGCRIF